MNARVPMVVVHFLACFGIQYTFLNNSHRIINDTCKFFQDPQKINNLKWHPDYSVPHSTPKWCFPFIVQTKIQLKIMTQGVNSRVDTCKSDDYFLIRQDREAYSRSKRPFQTSHRQVYIRRENNRYSNGHWTAYLVVGQFEQTWDFVRTYVYIFQSITTLVQSSSSKYSSGTHNEAKNRGYHIMQCGQRLRFLHE